MSNANGWRPAAILGIMQTYLIYARELGCVKIGKSLDPHSRMADLQTGMPIQLELLGTHKGDIERDLHEMFALERHGKTEWFAVSARLRSWIHERLLRRLRATSVVLQTPDRAWISKRNTKHGVRYHLRWICPMEKKWKSRCAGTDHGNAVRLRADLLSGMRTGADEWPTFQGARLPNRQHRH